ncbi:peptidylprolyl isomerase [uncultured Sphingomonas sp.]|uniref:peptidylprolyl isomerase n=1 Tax=uncultured Sphingomonas sp. TaxID=158754 RepID=UPI0035CBFA80
MLSFFRRLINSRLGIIVTFVVLAVIALAFAAGDVSGLRNGMFGEGTTEVATVGKTNIPATELRDNINRAVQSFRQQQPDLSVASFLDQGGLDGVLNRMIDGVALEQFANSQGMWIGKPLVDSQLRSYPSLKGLNGQFDLDAYKRILAEQRLSDQEVRTNIARGMIVDQLTLPTRGSAQVPLEYAKPFARLLLERRAGTVAFIPTKAMGAGALPTDAEITTFYRRNITRYTMPERRAARYLVIGMDDVKAKSAPTDAEIAQAYQQQRSKFAASENRTLRQVVLLDQKSADTLAAKVRGGTAIDVAAKAAGLTAGLIDKVDRAGYTTQTSQSLADQVFAAASGAVVGPARTPLGWTVVKVEAVTTVPAKSLDQARPELVKALTDQKTIAAMTATRQRIEDGIANNATLDEIARDLKMTVATTPAATVQGIDPDAKPPTTPDAKLAPLYQAIFAAQQDDDASLVPIGTDGSFAVAKLDKIVPATPRPAGTVKADVMRDFTIDRARRAAQAVASGLVDQVNKGTPLTTALAGVKVKLPATEPLLATRAQIIVRDPKTAPPSPALLMLFQMQRGTAKLLEAPNAGGWYVIVLDKAEQGDLTGKDGVVAAMRANLAQAQGSELIAQFVRAIRNQAGVKRNETAITKLRGDLLGGAAE